MTRAKGHFLDYLIETSNYFKKNKNITWFLNKNFDSQGLFIPKYCNIKKIIISNNFKEKKTNYIIFLKKYFILFSIFIIYFFSLSFL